MSLRGVIVQGDDDHGTRRRKDLTWIGALIWITRHPTHLAVKPTSQPFLQSFSLGPQRFSANDSHCIEAFSPRAFFDLFRKKAGISCLESAHDLANDQSDAKQS